uniref:SGNH hydrolase-type esterase domain-containing protein n=1 Tax=Zooxanthella nutricula TaxID=1333877 RepID=A0A6U6Q5C5_9DINO
MGSAPPAWQTWPDQLHAELLKLGYDVDLPSTAIPGELTRPAKCPVCADAGAYASLSTPRLGMVGWSSWGFSFDSTADCGADGYREIAGLQVSCTNGWACNPEWTGSVPLVPVSTLAEGVRGSDVVILANWINDYKAWQSPDARRECYGGVDIGAAGTVSVTAADLQRQIRAIHAESPDTVILVLARYPDLKQVIYVNERTLPEVIALNNAVKAKVEMEKNTYFVNITFPLGEAIFQTLSLVHPNCRGDRVMVTDIVEAMYDHKILSRGLALGSIDNCLARSDCESLNLPCCQRSAMCFVDSAGACARYGRGKQ